MNFNSRPSARGDIFVSACPLYKPKFQFTPLREGRQLSKEAVGIYIISIHAPPRGATRDFERSSFTARNFNSRPSARGDGRMGVLNPLRWEFQFTPLREGRRYASGNPDLQRYFNSRPSARGDTTLACDVLASYWISIHAPPRGATRLRRHPRTWRKFQFTPLREGRLSTGSSSTSMRNFNSRPSARGDGKLGAENQND